MATPQATSLANALKNIRIIKYKLAESDLTRTVFSSAEAIPDNALDNARGAIGLEFQSLVQNIRAIKKNDPIVVAYPDIHWNLKEHVARYNWLAREYETTAPVKWNEIATSVYDDVPKIESAIIAALKAQGIPKP